MKKYSLYRSTNKWLVNEYYCDFIPWCCAFWARAFEEWSFYIHHMIYRCSFSNSFVQLSLQIVTRILSIDAQSHNDDIHKLQWRSWWSCSSTLLSHVSWKCRTLSVDWQLHSSWIVKIHFLPTLLFKKIALIKTESWRIYIHNWLRGKWLTIIFVMTLLICYIL